MPRFEKARPNLRRTFPASGNPSTLAVLLVPPRLLRRIIKRDRKLTHLGLQVPHRKCYVIGREDLLALATLNDLGVRPQRGLPETLLRLYGPSPDRLAVEGRGQTLVKYWALCCSMPGFTSRLWPQAIPGGPGYGCRHPAPHPSHWSDRGNQTRTVLRQEKFWLSRLMTSAPSMKNSRPSIWNFVFLLLGF